MVIRLFRTPLRKLAVVARLAPDCSLGLRTLGLFQSGVIKAKQPENSTLKSGQLECSLKDTQYAFGVGASCTLFGLVVIYLNNSFPTISNDNNKSEVQEDLKETTSASGNEEKNSWHGLSFLAASLPVSRISSTISTWTWPSLPDFDIPGLKDKISSLLLELGLDSGSLYEKIVNQPPDMAIHPECEWDAEVRLGDDLCIRERAYLRERKRKMRKSFAEFIDVPEVEIHEEDIPVVAIAGSGGGYRAMLNTTGSLTGAKVAGLFDCVSYVAGISGSCWALGVIYSGVSGSTDPFSAGQHIKDRIKLSYIDMSTLEALITAPTNEYLLSGILHKATSPGGTVSLVDLYGTMLASRLFVPPDLSKLDPRHLSLSQFCTKIDNGTMPLPIFTALHHAIPPVQAEYLEEYQLQQNLSKNVQREGMQAQQRRLDEETPSRWLWYEFTPYEVGCDELGAWIPSWALGRRFMNGKSLDRRPELSFSILIGIFGSAFCASLKHYFSEVKPLLQALPFQLYNWLEEIVNENYERDMGVIHPVLPNEVSNFVKGLTGQLRSGSPEGITEQDTLGLMDAGAELNIPYYPLLRRQVDCVVALDASADSQDLWFKRAEELAVKRGLRTWPRGTGWPVQITKVVGTNQSPGQRVSTPGTDAKAANLELAEQQEFELAHQTEKQVDSGRKEFRMGDSLSKATEQDFDSVIPTDQSYLSTCEVWIGSSKADDNNSSRMDDIETEALLERDGIAIVYMPLTPNARRVPDYDPTTLSTWTREVDPEESQRLLDIAEANFIEGIPKIRTLLRAIWLRKKHEREVKETERYMFRF